VIVCPGCGVENAAGARFCSACGSPLEGAAAPAREERKVVTVLFADLVGFTARAEQLDPEDVRALLAPYHAHLRAELERFGGTVEKFIGDAVMALFGAPTAHEDDPERAVRAALEIRDWANEQDDLQVRIAVNTGEALVALGARASEGEGMAAGDVVNTAARLQSAAPVNGVLVGQTTYRATNDAIDYREAEPVEAKGKSEPIRVWEALEARSRLGTDLPQARAPLVGRERELDLLRDALERARSQRALQLVTLVGVPGIGKSRLVYELFRLVEAEPDFTTWRQGRSLPYGEGVSFWALAEIVKAQAGILESDSEEDVERKLAAAVREAAADPQEAAWMAARLRSLVGLVGPGDDALPQSESFSAWRSYLEALADERPLVLVFEDLHWADDGLLDFVDQLVEWARSAPILVLCTARPELLERRPGWGGGKANATTISLPPLEDKETARLLSSLLETPVLEADTQAELLSRAAGNPLYAEQYARMLAERGTTAELPETVQGIIAARLDVLSEAEKALLQDAAVVGKVFWVGSVCAIGGSERSAAKEALLRLERKELVQRARRSSVEGEGEYAFRHLLVRDVAYGQIPRAPRADKHRAAAEWVEALGRPDDHAEMLAAHYSRALEYASAAGLADAELTTRTRLALRDAGDRAFGLLAWAAALGFYKAALDLWPEDDPERPHVALRFGRSQFNVDATGVDVVDRAVDDIEALGDLEAAAAGAVATGRIHWLLGDPERSREYYRRALGLVSDRADSQSRVAALAELAGSEMYDGQFDACLKRIAEALPAAERLGLGSQRARLLQIRGYARTGTGDEGGFEDFRQAIALARELHDGEQLQSALNNLMARQVSLGRLDEALETLAAIERSQQREATVARQRWVAVVRTDTQFMRGDWDEARRGLEVHFSEIGRSPHILDPAVRHVLSMILLAEGDLATALEEAELTLAAVRKSTEAQLVLPGILGAAAVFLEAGRRDEAEALLDEALAYGQRLVVVINDTPIVLAAWLAHDLGRGEDYAVLLREWPGLPWAEAAEAVCAGEYTRAADVLERIGFRPGEAYARLRAARQLVKAGRRAEADAELERALAFWREVGATRYVREGEELLVASA
jgi:class 3 adenylate cyclase/tetratricopeptide (TPR) repeat protein